MWGGCPARAPPDVNQIEIEVTWEEERAHQESPDLPKSPSPGGMGKMGSASPCPDFPHHQGPSVCQSHHRPVPWIPGCAGSCSRPLMPQPERWCLSLLGQEEASPFSTESSLLVPTLPWEHCHRQVSSLLGFSPFVRVCTPRVLLLGSGSEPLISWGSLVVFLFCGLHLQCNRSFIHSVWGEKPARKAGRHTHSA